MPVPDILQQIEMGDLLVHSARSVLRAQQELDEFAVKQRDTYINTPNETFAMPPLWYTIQNVGIELEFSSEIATESFQPQLICRLVNPAAVALFGYRAVAGSRVSVTIGTRTATKQSELCDTGADST